jgi:uncharacterized damage-inducible protein DinB
MERLFVTFSINKLKQLESRIQECLDRLSPEQIWWRPSEENNSVANLVLHLTGNVRQWIISSVGGAADTRERDAEFAARGQEDLQQLRSGLSDTVAQAVQTIEGLSAARLADSVRVQGYDKSVLEVVYHVVEHFSQHTGQIIYITKALQKQDLGFYSHLKSATHGEKTP